MNDILRREVKELKLFQNIQYKEIAEHLEIKLSSFYNFMNKQYNLSAEKQKRLREIIELFKEY